jgi:hypothetical protein
LSACENPRTPPSSVGYTELIVDALATSRAALSRHRRARKAVGHVRRRMRHGMTNLRLDACERLAVAVSSRSILD